METRWLDLLTLAVEEPGTLNQAFRAFHGYSFGNQLLAYFQCKQRNIPLGPIATYPAWQAKGRQVRRGEKAITLCMPVTRKKVQDGEETVCTSFLYKANWFVLGQTDGPELQWPPLPSWQKALALRTLDITEEPFQYADGNALGYAKARVVAVSPLAPNAWTVLFHEIAHVLMHTGDHLDAKTLQRSVKEVEAECVAYLVSNTLSLGDAADCRGYIQHWLGGKREIPNVQGIFATTDTVLRAGRELSPVIPSPPKADWGLQGNVA